MKICIVQMENNKIIMMKTKEVSLFEYIKIKIMQKLKKNFQIW